MAGLRARSLCSATKAVERATLAAKGVDHVHGGDRLTTSVLRVRHAVADHILEKDCATRERGQEALRGTAEGRVACASYGKHTFQYAACLLVYEAADSLDPALATELADGRLGLSRGQGERWSAREWFQSEARITYNALDVVSQDLTTPLGNTLAVSEGVARRSRMDSRARVPPSRCTSTRGRLHSDRVKLHDLLRFLLFVSILRLLLHGSLSGAMLTRILLVSHLAIHCRLIHRLLVHRRLIRSRWEVEDVPHHRRRVLGLGRSNRGIVCHPVRVYPVRVCPVRCSIPRISILHTCILRVGLCAFSVSRLRGVDVEDHPANVHLLLLACTSGGSTESTLVDTVAQGQERRITTTTRVARHP